MQAVLRNEVVAALADAVLVPHAAPGGKTEGTTRNVLARGQRLFTVTDENNAHLIDAGAEPFDLDRVSAALSAPHPSQAAYSAGDRA